MESFDSKSTQEKFDNVQEMFKDAEDTFKKGIGSLNDWTEQARHLIQNKPGVLLAAVGISGFVTGALLRHGLAARKEFREGGEEMPLPIEPLLLFAAGIFAGVTAGPKIIQEAASGLSRAAGKDSNIRRMDDARLYATEPMNEKPFEKF